jgi:hypothetical protein
LTTYPKNFVNQKKRNKEQNGNFSKLENLIALGMGVGTQPNFIDALPNNLNCLTLSNKMWRVASCLSMDILNNR